MNDFLNFAEHSVKKEFVGAYKKQCYIIIALFIILPMVWFVLSFFMLGDLGIIVFFVFCPTILFITVPIIRNKYFNTEYDYSVSSGELHIAEVHSKKRRKEIITIDIKKAEAIAPYRDKYRDSADRIDYDRVIDASSSMDSPDLYYAVIADADDEKSKTIVFFEPTSKMLSLLYSQNPRTVKTAVRF